MTLNALFMFALGVVSLPGGMAGRISAIVPTSGRDDRAEILGRALMAKYTVTRTDGKPIPEDEPCFVIRGQDIYAVTMVGYYMDRVKDRVSAGMMRELDDHLHRILKWQEVNGVKVPD